MSRAALRLEGETLRIEADFAGIHDLRTLDAADTARFERWTSDYRRALRQLKPGDQLLSLGREIGEWLDGPERWLARLRREATPPLLLDLEVSRQPSDAERAFLEAPWELVADATGHLAGRDDLLFCPVRRIGKPGTQQAPSDYRLSVVFMAAVPEGESALRFEEEEVAILKAAGNIGLDLHVEDTGALPFLCEQMARQAPVDVLHLSCHGTTVGGPQLLFENDLGRGDPVTPGLLASRLGANLPQRLLFVSACSTADPDAVVGSFAAAATLRGCPAVLGWGGPVRDTEASRFAAELYRYLSQKQPLESALAHARQALLAPPAGAVGHVPRDWHLARLYLGPSGGGALTRSDRARSRRRKDAHTEMLDKKRGRVPVASREEFVGRRRELRELLREVRANQPRAGILLHGFGGHGKSSLVARLAHRCPEHAVAVVADRYDALSVLDAVGDACARSEVTEILKKHRPAVRDSGAALRDALREILEGPCRETQKNGRGDVERQPILLVIDDFEHALDPPGETGLHTVKPELVEAVRAVIEAFQGADTTSRLVLTSRHRFTLPNRGADVATGLLDVHVGPMGEADRTKQALARLGKAVEAKRARRCIEVARGNARLQDRLFQIVSEDETACDAVLVEIERYLSTGADPTHEAVRELFEGLALDALIGCLTDSEREMLRASTLFELPVPLGVLDRLAETLVLPRAAASRLLAFGLWDGPPDLFDPTQPAAMVNPLVRPRSGTLTGEEAAAIAVAVAETLFLAWGGASADRMVLLDVELVRVGVLARHAGIAGACGGRAVQWWLHAGRAREADALGKEAVSILEAHRLAVPVPLLRVTAEACDEVGDAIEARRLLAMGLDAATGAELPTEELAALHLIHGRRLRADGALTAALGAFERARALLAGSRFLRERTVITGDIARIRVSKGDVDEALRLHQQRLTVFEELGDWRERAVTLGDIAHIRVDKGDVDEALRLHQEELTVFEELGDRRSRAVTLGDIARIRVSKGQVDEALQLYQEMLTVFEELGDRRSRAVTLGDIARIRVSKGQLDEALRLHQERLTVFEELGDRRERALTLGDIARIRVSKGQLDEALRLHQERLTVFEELGAADGVANTQWSLGQLAAQEDRANEARERLEIAYSILLRTGRLDAICVVGLDLAPLLSAAGQPAQAKEILERSRDGFLALGQHEYAAHAEDLLGVVRLLDFS